MRALILAGGKGERLGRITADIPKPMVEVAGKPYLGHIIDKLRAEGIKDIGVSVGYKKEIIMEYIFNHFEGISIIPEAIPLGDGGAIRHSMDILKVKEILVVNGDVYVEGDYLDVIKEQTFMGNILTIGIIQTDDISRFGEVKICKDARIVTGFKEKTREERKGLINTGIYAINKKLFDGVEGAFKLSRHIEKTLDNIYCTNIGYHEYTGKYIDMGTPEDLEKLKVILGER